MNKSINFFNTPHFQTHVYCDCNHVMLFLQGRPGINGHKGEKGDSVGLPVSFSRVSPKKYYCFIRKKVSVLTFSILCGFGSESIFQIHISYF